MSRCPFNLFFVLLLCCGLAACASDATTAADQEGLPARALQIEAPASSPAGIPTVIIVHTTPISATSPIFLAAQGTFGLYPQRQTPVNGRATFTLPALQTQYAGLIRLTATAGAAEARSEFAILPGIAADPVLPLVGPRSITADGQHWTMVIAALRDKFLNPVADNTMVTLRVQHPVLPGVNPQTGLEIIETHTRYLLAWERVFSRTRAGQMLISVRGDEAHSPERAVREVPGLPIPFALAADSLNLPADGRQLVQIQSAQMMDRFGNLLLDGSSVTLLAAMNNGERRSLPAMTVEGRIYTTLQAPTQPGVMTVQAWIAGIASQPLRLTFTPGPAVQMSKLAIKIDAQAIVVVAGPLIGPLEQFIPDGTEVTFTIKAPNGTEMTNNVVADYGYATLQLHRPGLASGMYTVTAVVGTGAGQITFQLP